MFKVNKKTPERRHWLHSDVFIVNVEYILLLFLVPLLLTLNKSMLAGFSLENGCFLIVFISIKEMEPI